MPNLFKLPFLKAAFTFIDVETTGLDSNEDEAIEVGIAKFIGGELVDVTSSFVSNIVPIKPGAQAVHGIKQDDLVGAPILEDYLKSVAHTMIQDCVLGAYNSDFDRGFLPGWLSTQQKFWVDPLMIAQEYYVKPGQRHTLLEMCKRLDIPYETKHRAREDAVACGKVFYRMCSETFSPNSTVVEIIKWSEEARLNQWVKRVTR